MSRTVGAMRSGSAHVMALLAALAFAAALGAKPVAAHEASLRGLVLGVVPARDEVVVRHEELGRTEMSTFRVVPPAALAGLRIGTTIAATADTDASPPTLSGLRAIAAAQRVTGASVAADDAAPSVLRSVHHLRIGEFVPNAVFVDQRDQPFSLRALRGQMVVMGFVYSRCRDARACPLVSAKFHTLQERLRGEPVRLVEVTLDPAHDTPAVLARYGTTFGADPRRWTLATGDPERVLDLAAQFDVTAFPDERVGLIHPERLVVIDQYGLIRELIDEGSWSPGELVAVVQHDRQMASNPFERLNLWLSSAAVAVCGNSVASFSGFTDLLTVIAIVAFFGYLFWRLGRSIARGAT